jgi:hypothetical protein
MIGARKRLRQWVGRLTRRPKILGIGLSRTGTTSLTSALTILGYRTTHYPAPNLMLEGRYYAALWGVEAATDVTASAFFKELDEAFPGSRFILTVRDERSWLESFRVHLAHPSRQNDEHLGNGMRARVRRKVYGTVCFEPEKLLSAARAHDSAVREYFRGRPEDLLVLDIFEGDGWEKLCAFLAKPIPQKPFPHLNRKAKTVQS